MDHLGPGLGDLFTVQNYKNVFNPEIHHFHTFPQECGWDLDDDTLEFQIDPHARVKNAEQFFQSWLFFGLLATVLQVESLQHHKFHQNFISKTGGSINTIKLDSYLREWKEKEIREPIAHRRSLRMIRAQVALEKARQVVFEYFSVGGTKYKPQETGALTSIHDHLGLSLMVLGETLMNAKSKIVEQVGFNIKGWHGDAYQGWGTPPCILSSMKNDKWCERTVHVLICQLRSHATALLSAYRAHEVDASKPKILIRGHEECKTDKCIVKSEKSNGQYKTQHQTKCEFHTQEDLDTELSHAHSCYWIGPETEKLVQTIENGQIPLLKYIKNKDGTRDIDIVPYKSFKPYVTISHVWADGYGNPTANKLWKCQLDYFEDLVQKASEDHVRTPTPPELFWIDTLAIPILEENKEQRNKAIRKIHDIYTNATYTIVIDKGLCQLDPGSDYEKTAMKILLSGWMRRLWTLQEAYLSKRLIFAFVDKQMKNLDDLEDMFPEASDILTSNIPNAARTYFHNLLGNDRKARINDFPSGEGYDVLASAWRAARWRTTNHREHETLALATLLNVDYHNEIQDAGILRKDFEVTETHLEGMMRDLWVLLDKTCPGSIPPGIIFLPGTRLSLPGFRWAPSTWMSAQEVDYPDPLANMIRPAKLAPEGLLVHYSGFLLHAENRSSILKENEDTFRFPSDSTLLEWYAVEIEKSTSSPSKGIDSSGNRLAIILCRERPRELREIALLVEIEQEITQRSFQDHRRSKIYRVSIVSRVKIRREVSAHKLSGWRDYITDSTGKDDNMICGEVLDAEQRWYVDGPDAAPATPKRAIDPTIAKRSDTYGKSQVLRTNTAASKAAATQVKSTVHREKAPMTPMTRTPAKPAIRATQHVRTRQSAQGSASTTNVSAAGNRGDAAKTSTTKRNMSIQSDAGLHS